MSKDKHMTLHIPHAEFDSVIALLYSKGYRNGLLATYDFATFATGPTVIFTIKNKDMLNDPEVIKVFGKENMMEQLL